MSHEFYQIMVGCPTMSLYSWKQLALWSLEYSCLSAVEKEKAESIWRTQWREFCQLVVKDYGDLVPGGSLDEPKAKVAYEDMKASRKPWPWFLSRQDSNHLCLHPIARQSSPPCLPWKRAPSRATGPSRPQGRKFLFDGYYALGVSDSFGLNEAVLSRLQPKKQSTFDAVHVCSGLLLAPLKSTSFWLRGLV